MGRCPPLLTAAVVIAMFGGAPVATGAENAQDAGAAILQSAAAMLCPDILLDPEGTEMESEGPLAGYRLGPVRDRGPEGRWVRREVRLEGPGGAPDLGLEATRAGGQLRRISLTLYDGDTGRPLITALANGACRIHHARALRYGDDGMALELVHLSADLTSEEQVEALNPAVPPGEDPGGVTVAHIDSGVNYLLPAIAERLARDAEGTPLGYDFWDLDPRPFDGDTGRSAFFPIRHGTPVASLLVKEAPAVRLLPYRYPRPDMGRMADLIDAAAAAGSSVFAMPLGSRKAEDWTAFEAAARRHSDLLFVVSAGNDGRDIDAVPLYPAALALENMLVVTSADAFGRLAAGSNWGPVSVDLMVPAEQLEVTDYRGARGRASGSSYAVPRVAALAARLKAANPQWRAADLKAAILDRAVAPLERGGPKVAGGWIPNPAEDG